MSLNGILIFAQVTAANGMTAHEWRLVFLGAATIAVVVVGGLGIAMNLLDRTRETPEAKANRLDRRGEALRRVEPRPEPRYYAEALRHEFTTDTSTKVWLGLIIGIVILIPLAFLFNG